MEFEQALEVVGLAFAQKIGRPMIQAEVALLFGAWNKLTYDRIAERSINLRHECSVERGERMFYLDFNQP